MIELKCWPLLGFYVSCMRYMALEYINGGQLCGLLSLYTRGQNVDEVSSYMPINSVKSGVVGWFWRRLVQ